VNGQHCSNTTCACCAVPWRLSACGQHQVLPRLDLCSVGGAVCEGLAKP
jgi:hypothetical protein